MFDKIRRKASRAVKRAVGDAVEDEAERQARRQISKARSEIQSDIDQGIDHSFQGQIKKDKKVKGELITDFKKFKVTWEKHASDPIDSLFYFLMAEHVYSSVDKDLGEAMATLILSKKHNVKAVDSPSGLKFGKTNKYLFEHMREDPNIAKSYLGASYQDDYKFDEKNLIMHSEGIVPEDDKHLKVIIRSGGKDYPSPVSLAKNKNGQWKVTEFSSLATGCKKAASIEDDF
ncbi:MAG: DUF6935 domain-containing protein [Candidatus Heimdallarchaeota archaeon]